MFWEWASRLLKQMHANSIGFVDGCEALLSVLDRFHIMAGKQEGPVPYDHRAMYHSLARPGALGKQMGKLVRSVR